MTSSTTDDLLAPSLDATDDVVGFDAPWDPWHLMYAAFFGGPFAGGLLLAQNYRRLGEERFFAPCLIAFGVLTFAAVAGGVMAFHASGDDGPAGATRMLVRVVGLVATGLGAFHQRRRFRIFANAGGESAPLFVPALIAVLAAIPVVLIAAFVSVALFAE